MTLESVLDKFRNDKSWNTEEKDGSHRFDDKIKWIEEMVNKYAKYFKLSADEIITIMEDKRTYSWPNYYQEANFKDASKFGELVGIFKTFDEFNDYSKKNWMGFKCPKCGTIGKHPQECQHRIDKDKKCDWCAYGLFKAKDGVIILENGFGEIPIFEPMAAEMKSEVINDIR